MSKSTTGTAAPGTISLPGVKPRLTLVEGGGVSDTSYSAGTTEFQRVSAQLAAAQRQIMTMRRALEIADASLNLADLAGLPTDLLLKVTPILQPARIAIGAALDPRSAVMRIGSMERAAAALGTTPDLLADIRTEAKALGILGDCPECGGDVVTNRLKVGGVYCDVPQCCECGHVITGQEVVA